MRAASDERAPSTAQQCSRALCVAEPGLQPLLMQTCILRLPAQTSTACLSGAGTLAASLSSRSLLRGAQPAGVLLRCVPVSCQYAW